MKYNDDGEWKYIPVKVANAIQNEYGESNNDGYSQNYLNEHTINVGVNDTDFRVNFVKGNNLFDKTNIINASITNNTGALGLNDNFRTIWFRCKPNTKYRYSQSVSSNRYVVGFSNTFITTGTLTNITSSLGFTSPNNANYCYIMITKLSDETSNLSDILNSIMINEGEDVLPYEPYVEKLMALDGDDFLYQEAQNYSLGEKLIGTWIDGKPLYRKVYTITSMTNSNTNLASISDVETPVNISGFIITSTNKYPINLYESSTNYNVVFYSPPNNALRGRVVIGDTGTFQKANIIFEYTKTTETTQNRALSQNNNDGEIVSGQEE